jgi:hypothetical protein
MALKRGTLTLAGLLGGLALLSGMSARADFQIVLESGSPTPGPALGQYTYTYDLVFATATDSSSGQAVERLDNASAGSAQGFVTLYDIQGYAGYNSSSVPSDINAEVRNTGKNAFGQSPTDTSLTNITFYYNGASPLTTDKTYAGIQVYSTDSATQPYNYTDQTTKNTGALAGSPNGAIGFVLEPATVPEPASMALLTIGGIGMALAYRRRNRA